MKFRVGIQISPKFLSKFKKKFDKHGNKIITEFIKILKKNTPKKTGRARRSWVKKGKGANSYAYNRQPYIRRLDQGYSKQAPKGILRKSKREPTLPMVFHAV